MDIFERELAGEVIDPQTDPEFNKFLAVQRQSCELTKLFAEYDERTMLIPPFYTDFGKNTRIGKGLETGCMRMGCGMCLAVIGMNVSEPACAAGKRELSLFAQTRIIFAWNRFRLLHGTASP